MIYLDNAATSFPKPQCVADAMAAALATFGNSSRGAHDFALAASRGVENARALVAEFFGCARPDRVAFTKNVTEALNIAVNSIDGHVIVTEAEHNSVLRPVHRRGNYGVVPVDGRGRYSTDDIRRAVRGDSAAVVLGHASNLTGNVAPIMEIGEFCRERGLLLVVDAAQTAGLADIDMERMRIDALCFTGHKALYGPQGTGGICLGSRFTPRPLVVGGGGHRTFEPDQPPDMPGVLEAGTLNAPGIAALAAGIDYVRQARSGKLLAAANRLARMFRDGLRDEPGVVFYGDFDAAERMPIVSLNVGNLPSDEVAAELAERHGMAVRAGAHCAPLLHLRFGTAGRGAVRFSFSHANRDGEVASAVRAVAEMARRRS